MIEYGYDSQNRLTSFTNTENNTWTYAYNDANQRISKTSPTNETTKFYWDRGYAVNEYKSNSLYATNKLGIGGIISRNGVNLLKDAHGDVSSLGGANPYTYNAYGVQTNSTGDSNPYRYCGEYWDEESGLIYLRNRYYDPNVGRFISEDPIRDGANWYAYCGGNPVMYIDPTGLYADAMTWGSLWSASAVSFAAPPYMNAVVLSFGGGYTIGTPIGESIFDLTSGFVCSPSITSSVGYPGSRVTSAVYTQTYPWDNSISLPPTVAAAAKATAATIPALPIDDGSILAGSTVQTIPYCPTVQNGVRVDNKTTYNPPDDLIIYRYGYSKEGINKLVPTSRDVMTNTGLSFSTIPRPGSAVTTIGALNATGIVYAVQDTPTHVAVYPIGTTIEGWHYAGSTSPWTIAVNSVLVN